MRTVFVKACEKIETLIKNGKLDGNRYKSHRIAIGTLITNYDEDPERAGQLLEAVKGFHKEENHEKRT